MCGNRLAVAIEFIQPKLVSRSFGQKMISGGNEESNVQCYDEVPDVLVVV